MNETCHDAVHHIPGDEVKSLYGVVDKALPAGCNTASPRHRLLDPKNWHFKVWKQRMERLNSPITGLFLNGILDKDSFSIRLHTVGKTKWWENETAFGFLEFPTDLKAPFVSCRLTRWPHQLPTKTPGGEKGRILMRGPNNTFKINK